MEWSYVLYASPVYIHKYALFSFYIYIFLTKFDHETPLLILQYASFIVDMFCSIYFLFQFLTNLVEN